MNNFHQCMGCVWTKRDCEICNNPLSEYDHIEQLQDRCEYYINKDDLREMYSERILINDWINGENHS